MLDKMAANGAHDACRDFGVSLFKIANAVPPPSLLNRAKSFGSNQLGAARSLYSNIKGMVGGPAPLGEGMHGPMIDHKANALTNLKTLAPSLAVGGGLALMHHNKNKEEEQRQMQGMPRY